MKLTDPQLDELKRLAQGQQPTYGRARARVQNSLHGKGLARFFVDGKPLMVSGHGSWADTCEITQAGRAALAAGETARKPRRRVSMRGLGAELAELERTNPDVKAAADNYERVRGKILANARGTTNG